jgi:hypothetical protein
VRAAVARRSVVLGWRASASASALSASSASVASTATATAAGALESRLLAGALVRVHPPRQQRYILLRVRGLGRLAAYPCPGGPLFGDETLGLWLAPPSAAFRHLYRLTDLSDALPGDAEIDEFVATHAAGGAAGAASGAGSAAAGEGGAAVVVAATEADGYDVAALAALAAHAALPPLQLPRSKATSEK